MERFPTPIDAAALSGEYTAPLARASRQLRELGFAAEVGIVLGSGLGDLAEQWPVRTTCAFADIEGLHAPSVPGHGGRLLQLDAPRPALVMAGRLHAYEGHSFAELNYPIALLVALGCRVLVLSNAAGGLNPRLQVGDFLLLSDLIDLHLADPLRGLRTPSEPELQLRAGTHARSFDAELSACLLRCAQRLGLSLTRGVYASVFGPSYETRAEIGFLRRAGADAVGMSTGPEVAMARALGARVVGLSCITNLAREADAPAVSHADVVQVSTSRRAQLGALLMAFLCELETQR